MNKFENVDIFASLDATCGRIQDFSKVIFDIDKEIIAKAAASPTERIRRCYGFAARPGRIVLRSATCS